MGGLHAASFAYVAFWEFQWKGFRMKIPSREADMHGYDINSIVAPDNSLKLMGCQRRRRENKFACGIFSLHPFLCRNGCLVRVLVEWEGARQYMRKSKVPLSGCQCIDFP